MTVLDRSLSGRLGRRILACRRARIIRLKPRSWLPRKGVPVHVWKLQGVARQSPHSFALQRAAARLSGLSQPQSLPAVQTSEVEAVGYLS